MTSNAVPRPRLTMSLTATTTTTTTTLLLTSLIYLWNTTSLAIVEAHTHRALRRPRADAVGGEACSCSPRTYNFKLDLSASCPSLPPPFPPNNVFGGAVADYTCNIGREPIPKSGSRSSSTKSLVMEGGGTRARRQRDLMAEEGMDLSDGTALGDFFPEVQTTPTEIGDDLSDVFYSTTISTPQPIDEHSMVATEDSAVPVSIYSIQFLEVDGDFNVINQDSTYVRNIEFQDGDSFNYTSIIAQNDGGGDGGAEEEEAGAGAIPGGMNMVLRGVNAAGDPVRNVFTITYNNECGIPTFEMGDAIGWVVFEDFEPATDETCFKSAPTPQRPITPFPTEEAGRPVSEPTTSRPPAEEGDTKEPSSLTPTPTPSNSVNSQPSSSDMVLSMTYHDVHHYTHAFYSDKSGKGSKSSSSYYTSSEGGGWYDSWGSGKSGKSHRELHSSNSEDTVIASGVGEHVVEQGQIKDQRVFSKRQKREGARHRRHRKGYEKRVYMTRHE